MKGKNRRNVKISTLPLREKIAVVIVALALYSLMALLLFSGHGDRKTPVLSSTAYACSTPPPPPTPMYDTYNHDYEGEYPKRYDIQYVHYE